MTKEELKQGISELEATLNSDKNALYIKYLNAHNTVKKGDKITDGLRVLIVDRISYTMGLDSMPYCLYYGKWLTAKGVPNKKGETACISQPQLKEIL